LTDCDFYQAAPALGWPRQVPPKQAENTTPDDVTPKGSASAPIAYDEQLAG
jgi:hypothetical protein